MILKILKTHWWLLFFVLIFGLSRIINLTSLPVFGDEAIYIRWSQIIKSEEGLRFIPMSDGKQPLFMWISAIFLKLSTDPLFSSRLVSVLSSLGTLLILYFGSLYFFNSSISKIVSLLYIFTPFFFFFDRLATADSLLTFFGVASFFLTLLLARFPRLDISIFLGLALGLAWITKSPAIYFFVLSISTFLFLKPSNIKYLHLEIFSLLIGFFIYNLLRLGPQFHMIASRNLDYIWTLKDIIPHPFDPLLPHLGDVKNIFLSYISLPLLFIFGSLKSSKFSKLILITTAWAVLPLFSNAIFAKVFTARYILFCIPYLLLLLSIGFYNLFSKIKLKFLFTILTIFLIPNIIFIFNLSTKPYSVTLPPTELGYLNDWTSGWGIKSVSDYLILQSKKSNVILGTEGYFGTTPDGVQIYTNKIPQLTVIGIGLGISKIPQNLLNAKNYGDDVYILLNTNRNNIQELELYPVKMVLEFIKPDKTSLRLYQLI